MAPRPRRRFGQNFLADGNTIRRMVAAIAPRQTDQVIEIGPGRGALTAPLLHSGARLHALELDRDLAAELRTHLSHQDRLTVRQGDALDVDLGALASPDTLPRIVGNLPYNVSTPLVFHVLAASHAIQDAHFLLQREVVTRMAASPGNRAYGRLSVMTQWHADVIPLFDVPASAFRPAPEVVSTFVRLIPHREPPVPGIDTAALREVVTRAFGKRRKTLRNSLRGLVTAGDMLAAGIDPGARAETLTLAAFARLSDAAARDTAGTASSNRHDG